MTLSAMTADQAATARTKPARSDNDRKLAVLISVYGLLSAAFYGALCWGAYRAVEGLLG